MIITPERFSQGYSWEQYLTRIRRNHELFQKSYDSVELTDDETGWLRRFSQTTYVVGIGEDWCPDVHGNLPVVARIASWNPEKIILRIFPRDNYGREMVWEIRQILESHSKSTGRMNA